MADKVNCPIVDEKIEDIECIETVDAVKKIVKEKLVPDKFMKKEGWKEICMKCEYHNY